MTHVFLLAMNGGSKLEKTVGSISTVALLMLEIQMPAFLKVFDVDRGATCATWWWWSTLKNLGRTKLRGSGAAYGQRAPTSGTTMMIGRGLRREGCAQLKI